MTTTSSTVPRSGPAARTTAATESSSLALIRRRQAPGHQLLHLPDGPPGIRSRPSSTSPARTRSTRCSSTTCGSPRELRVGEENDGWRLTKVTLANERVMLSSAGSLWGAGPSAADLVDLVRSTGGVDDPRLRQRLADLYCEARCSASAGSGRCRPGSRANPGSEASIQKVMADEHGQHVMQLAKALAGTAGMLEVGVGGPGAARRSHRRDRDQPGPGPVPRRRPRSGTTGSCSPRRSPSVVGRSPSNGTSSASSFSACLENRRPTDERSCHHRIRPPGGAGIARPCGRRSVRRAVAHADRQPALECCRPDRTPDLLRRHCDTRDRGS